MGFEYTQYDPDEEADHLSRAHFNLLRRMWLATHDRDLPVEPPVSRELASQIALSLLHRRLEPDEALRDWLRVTGSSLACAPNGSELSYNLRRTLRLLLSGDSVEEVAQEIRVTVQVAQAYADALYAKFGVKTRSELMALWIWPGFQTNGLAR